MTNLWSHATVFPLLVYGVTVLLGLGVGMMVLARTPIRRQRLGEMFVGLTMIWMILAVIPMRRVDLGWSRWTALSDTPLAEVRNDKSAVFSMSRDNALRKAPDAFLPSSAPAQRNCVAQGRVRAGKSTSADRPESRSDVTESVGESLSMESEAEADVAAAGPTISRAFPDSTVANPPPPVRFDWVLFAWLQLSIGAAGACWLVLGRWSLWRAGRNAEQPSSLIRDVYSHVPGSRRACVLVTDRIGRPISFGLYRSVIMLPRNLCAGADVRVIRNVLLHEQAHVQRRDAWGHLLFNLALPLLVLHPLYWWLRLQTSFARELIADDWAAGQTEKVDYVDDLLSLLRRGRPSASPLTALAVFRFRHPFSRRMTMLLHRTERLDVHAPRSWLISCGGLGMTLVILLAAVMGQDLATADDPANDATTSLRLDESGVAAENETPQGTDVRDDQPERISDPVRSTRVEVGRCQVQVREIVIASQVSGPLKSLDVRRGTEVRQGQPLAAVDEQRAAAALQRVELAVQAARQRTHNLGVEAAEKAAEVAKAEYESAREVLEKTPRAISQLEMKRLALAAERARLQVQLVQRETDALRVEEESVRNDLVEAKHELDRCRVLAPTDGVVTEVLAQPGEWVQVGKPLVRIAQMAHVQIHGMLNASQHNPEDVIGRPAIARVTRARGEVVTVPGTVSYVDPLIQPNNTYLFRMDCKNPRRNGQWLLRPGMTARLTIDVALETAVDEPTDVLIEAPRVDPLLPAAAADYIESGSSPPSTDPPKGDVYPEDITSLKELVGVARTTLEHVKRLAETGTQGVDGVAMAQHHLSIAEARLAQAQGDREAYRKHSRAALQAAEQLVELMHTMYKSGVVSLDRVLDAQTMRAEAKLRLNRMERELHK